MGRYRGGSWFNLPGGKLGVETGKRRYKEMQWELIVALLVAIPVILFPAAFVWYLNVGGIIQALREAMNTREKKAAAAKAAAR
jgi:hypothetical protein